MNLNSIKQADGLEPLDADLVEECSWVLRHNEQKHILRHKYYDDKVVVPDRGMKMPKEYKSVRFCTGWAAKSVNMLAERSMLDSVAVGDGAPDGFADDFKAMLSANKLKGRYRMAMPSNLIEGMGVWTVAAGGRGEPAATIRYNDAMSSGTLWDYKHDRIRACLVVTDYRTFGKSRVLYPSEAVLYAENANIVLTRVELNRWRAEYFGHGYGRAMAVAMTYKPSLRRPLGKSRISPAVMCYTDQMMQELRNMAIQSDLFSIPLKYILGMNEKQYDEAKQSMMDMYLSIFFASTVNEAGSNPLVGMLQAADMTPHIKAMDKIAELIAAETCLPVATFGIPGNGYTSSDALRASTDDLVMLAKDVNRTNGECLAEVARMAAAVMMDEYGKDVGFLIEPRFCDPAMPSDAANADAQVKIASVVEGYAGSEVFWERMGYPESDRERVMAALRSGQARQSILLREMSDAGAQ